MILKLSWMLCSRTLGCVWNNVIHNGDGDIFSTACFFENVKLHGCHFSLCGVNPEQGGYLFILNRYQCTNQAGETLG